MASGHARQQQQSRQKELLAELSSDRSSHSKQQGNGEEELQQNCMEQRGETFQEHSTNEEDDMEEEGGGGAEEQERESILQEEGDVRKAQQDFFASQIELQGENSLLQLHSQTERRHPTSSSQFMKDQETPSFSSMPMNADLLASPDAHGSFSSFPSKQVEGALQSCLSSAETQVTRLLQQAMDNVQSQVLRALHQAASDIIEHLGKEAAHRVVVAERKTALLELELSSVKQQALSMLLRLKADSDAQALDADKKYLVERRRAQDAEAKLAIAQDTSKRLRAELKKKGDILDKMQKLVQPMTEDHLHKPSRLTEGADRLENCSRGISSDKNRTSSAYSMEGTSILMCNGTLQQGVQCVAAQPNTAAALQVVDDLDKNQSSFSSETPAVGEDSLESRKHTCTSIGTPQDSQCTPGLHEGDMVSIKTDEERGDSLGNDRVDLLGPVEESHPVKLLESDSEREDRQVEQMPDAQLPPVNEILDEKIVPILTDSQGNVEDKDIACFQGSCAIIKGFYVRRKVRENGKLIEKKGTNLAVEKPGSSAVPDHDFKADSFVASSSDTVSKVKADVQEGEPQTPDLQNCLQSDVTDSTGLLGHPLHSRSLVVAYSENLRDDPLEEGKSSSDNGKRFELGPTSLRDQLAIETVEFARPDYEVATSLAELAAIGLEARSQNRAVSPPNARKEEIFIRPGKTGLRMKRKGISFDKKVSSQSEGRASKKPRPDKLDTGLTDSHTERVLRRNRGGKYSISKDSLSLESSRDNRRLMQGARQLLCLAEKKWR